MEHEVVDDQLQPVVEQVDQANLPARAVECVVLPDLDHGQVAPLAIERVTLPGQLLFLGEQLLAGGQPFVPGGDPGKAHGYLLARRRGAGLRPSDSTTPRRPKTDRCS